MTRTFVDPFDAYQQPITVHAGAPTYPDGPNRDEYVSDNEAEHRQRLADDWTEAVYR